MEYHSHREILRFAQNDRIRIIVILSEAKDLSVFG